MDQRLDCFHPLATAHDATVDMGLQVSLEILILLPLDIHPELGLLDDYFFSFLFFFFSVLRSISHELPRNIPFCYLLVGVCKLVKWLSLPSKYSELGKQKQSPQQPPWLEQMLPEGSTSILRSGSLLSDPVWTWKSWGSPRWSQLDVVLLNLPWKTWRNEHAKACLYREMFTVFEQNFINAFLNKGCELIPVIHYFQVV